MNGEHFHLAEQIHFVAQIVPKINLQFFLFRYRLLVVVAILKETPGFPRTYKIYSEIIDKYTEAT